jgi:hypothetical protein
MANSAIVAHGHGPLALLQQVHPLRQLLNDGRGGLGVDIEVILMQPGIFCIDNH